MINTVQVRNVKIGAGTTKIAVSLTGATQEEVLAQARKLLNLPADIVEWRLDHFSSISDAASIDSCLDALRDLLGSIPLLATFRTIDEGGQCYLSGEHYAALNEYMLHFGKIDLLDVELFTGEPTVRRLIAAAHAVNVPVVLSNHDFEKTPSREEMVSRLCRMQDLGADLIKLAVMPRSRQDVLTLMAATEEMHNTYAHQPLITMSMGQLGEITRICGDFFGSAVTFGAADRPSAPGQIPAKKLRLLLDLLASDDSY